MLDEAVVADLECTRCRSPLAPAEGENEALRCQDCGLEFLIESQVPRFAGDLGTQEDTAQTFGFQWKGFWGGLFADDVYGIPLDETRDYFLASTGLSEEELAGRKVLDAGTGSGRIPMSLEGSGATVYGVDIHDGIGTVAETHRGLKSARFFQCDLMNLPFRPATFDVIWSSGVLHHTPDTRAAFASVCRTLKPGGTAFIWLYGTELNHYRIFRHLLPFAHKFPASLVYAFSAVLSVGLYVAFNLMLAFLRVVKRGDSPPYRVLGFTIEDLSYKRYRSILLNLFDQLHPRYQREHSVDELKSWFEEEGFENITVTEATNTAVRGKLRSA